MFRQKVGIDLGTASTLIHIKDGIVLREPSVVTVAKEKVVAVGNEARVMIGKTPVGVKTVKPIQESVIADLELTEGMLNRFLLKARRRRWLPFDVAVAVPSEMTEVEKRAVRDCALYTGARNVYLVESAIAAAIGAGLAVQEAIGNFIVNMGGGTTEIAIISLSGIVFSKSTNIAGDQLDEAIIQYVKRGHNLLIGELTAEEIKMKIGTVVELPEPLTMEVSGRDLVTGLHRVAKISSTDVQEALLVPIRLLLQDIKYVLEKCPPALSSDLVQRGITLAGGGALLRGLDALIRDEMHIDVHVSEDPIAAVAEGIGKSWHLR